jgi:YgiT-type zinc finger domain-containing protein
MKKNQPDNFETCSLCNHVNAELTERTQIVGKGEQQVIVENVPMYHCRHCGGTYFSREVALALQKIRLNPELHTHRKSYAAATLELA